MRQLELIVLSLMVACSHPDKDGRAAEGSGDWRHGVVLEAEPYEPGDPDQGWISLTHDGYMSCGVPCIIREDRDRR